jgi:hypothetical protein
LFNAARQPVAFVPLTNINVGTLRQTGVAKQLLGSLERANATATMYVSKSKPNMAELSNLERMLQQAGSPMFDALVGANRESLLMTGALPRQSMDFRSVFPITGAAMAGLGDDTTSPELSKAKGGLAGLKNLPAAAKAAKAGPIKAANQTSNVLSAEESAENLRRLLEESRIKERLFHGSSSREPITEFKTGKMIKEEQYPGNTIEPWAVDNRDAVFLTPEPSFSEKYAGDEWEMTGGRRPTIYPVYVQAKKPWDYENPEHIEEAIKAYKEKFPLKRDPSGVPSEESMRHYKFEKSLRGLPARERDNWSAIETADLQDIIKGLGYDSFYVKEAGIKNLGVYDPRKIKSAIGNRGTYDVNERDITKAKGGLTALQRK